MGLSRFSSLITRKRFSFFIGLILCAASAGIFTSPVFAEYQYADGIITDSNDVRWEYLHVRDSEAAKESVTIKYFDKPSNATTIVVPSLSEVLTLIPNVSQTLDTYFLDDAFSEYQAAHFSEVKRESTASVNKLDMSNTAKIQIQGVDPIIDPEVETELIFGDQMVIGDGVPRSELTLRTVCTEFDDYHIRRCIRTQDQKYVVDSVAMAAPYWYLLPADEKTDFVPSFDQTVSYLNLPLYTGGFEKRTFSNVNYTCLPDGVEPDYSLIYFDSQTNYYNPPFYNYSGGRDGVFEGYKLKLANLPSFNYVGFHAFSNVTFSEDSRTITLSDGFDGYEIFANSNIKKVILKTNYAGDGVFRNCSDLTDVVFDDSVNTVSAEMFYGTNIGDLDFSDTNIKTIRMGAFKEANITSLNLEGVSRLEYNSFAGNGALVEVYLPKSIDWLGAYIFDRDGNIKKVTVAYDTLTSGTTLPFHTVLGGWGNSSLEELIVLAPYAENEEVKSTHTTYYDYKFHYDWNGKWTDEPLASGRTGGNNYGWTGYTGYTRGNEQQSEDDYAHVDTYKNVIAPLYFSHIDKLKKVTIGEGMEFIGAMAFYSTAFMDSVGIHYSANVWRTVQETGNAENHRLRMREWDLSLPDSLKGIGNLSLTGLGGKNLTVNLPSGLEYIGIAAFRGSMGLKADIDLPNLVFLGDEAFYDTQVRDIKLYDKLQYFGRQVFAGCPYVRNITIDYDIFNAEKNAFYDKTRSTYFEVYSPRYYDRLPVYFGFDDYLQYDSVEDIEAAGIPYDYRAVNGTYVKRYGVITFTDKVVTEYPVELYATPYYYNYGDFFGYISAEKIDMGDCPWKIIPPVFFSTSQIGEVVLPQNLERIETFAFTSTILEKELIIPDTVYYIGNNAFNMDVYDTDYAKIDVVNPISITKLPEALVTVGDFAFFSNEGLSTELDCMNLREIGNSAFAKTNLTNILLDSALVNIGDNAFVRIPTINNITVDVDLAGLGVLYGDYSFVSLFNQAEYYGYDAELNVNEVIFTDKTITNPTNKSIVVKFWAECEYGYYHGKESCWESEDHSDDGDNRWEYDDVTGWTYITTHHDNTLISSYTGTTSYFFNINANKLDLSRSGWTALPQGIFIGSKFDELLLPSGVTQIPTAAFFMAEIGGELKIPDTVSSFSSSAFINSKLETLILPSSLEACNNGALWGLEVSDAIIIPEGITALPNDMFKNIKAKRMELPESLEVIGENEFMLSKIEEELVLPNNLKEIKNQAFINADFLHSKWQGNPDGDPEKAMTVKITKLPDSLERIGNNAFHGYEYELDLDLPNLKTIGSSAFMQSKLRNVVLHDKIESIGWGAFLYNPLMRNMTFDCDFFGLLSSFYASISTVDPVLPESYNAYWNGSQAQVNDGSSFDALIFTDKNVTNPNPTAFAYFTANKIDIGNTKWTKIPANAFYFATVNEPITIPATVESIDAEAFQWSDVALTNTFSEGLKTIGKAAFYGAQVSGDLVIPSTVESIGWAAFNAGDADTNYGTVIIKPTLDYDKSNDQAIFQIFWNAKMDKLIIESPMLPVLGTLQSEPVMPSEKEIWGLNANGTYGYIMGVPTLRADGEPEFHGMTMREVEIKNLPVITANAFEECGNLEKVSFVEHNTLTTIDRYAFNNDTKLKEFIFGEGLVGKEVVLGTYAFNNTAIETIGEKNTDFDLTAANFNANATYVFSNLPALRSVSVPNNFSSKTIPAYTFANDPELAEANIAWELETIDNGAFNNDTKLAKLFIWGNADINEATDLTIPEQTTIFGYSDAPSEVYANNASRDNYDGKFYALDEVLYLTSNRTYVVLEQDEEGNNVDFKKDGLKLYALRRDGVILESDNWQQYTTTYPRSTVNISFDQGRGMVGSDSADIAALVFDAQKPFDYISLMNQNFANVDFNFLQMPSSVNPLVLINYPDGYTGNIRSTTLASMTKEEEEEYLREPEEPELEVPNTGVFHTVSGVAVASFSISALIILGGILIAKKYKE